jgi:hypothetical protein
MPACKICSDDRLYGPINADIVRNVALVEIAAKYKLTVRGVRRHLHHLPPILEGEKPGFTTMTYIAPITNNYYFYVPAPFVEVAKDEARDPEASVPEAPVADLEEEGRESSPEEQGGGG